MINTIAALLETIAQLFCIAGLYGKKVRINYYTGMLLGVLTILFYGINVNGYPTVLRLVSYLMMFLYCLVSYDKDIKKAIVNYSLSYVCSVLLEITVLTPISLLLTQGQEVKEGTKVLFSALVVLAFCLISRRTWLYRLSLLFQKKALFTALIILFMVYIMILLVQQAKQGVVQGTDAFLIVFIGVFLVVMLLEWQKASREIDRKENQLLMNRLYGDAYEELILLVREKQHDVKNHISAMQSIIYTAKSYEELVERQKDYCDYIMDESAMTSIVLSIENPLIAGFLYKRIKDAQELGIEVEYRLAFSGEPLCVSEYIIVEMLGILFDNAVEHVMGLEERRSLSVKLIRGTHKMKFTISNPYQRIGEETAPVDIESFFGKSSKGMHRGLGMNKLNKLARETRGKVFVEDHRQQELLWVDFSLELPL